MNTEKTLEKERKELEKRRNQQSQNRSPFYFIIFCIIIVLIHIVDEIATNLGSMVQSSVVTEFFVKNLGLEFDAGLAQMTLYISAIGSIVMIAPFYKALSDKIGRRFFLILNTFAMAAGMLIAYFSNSVIMYLIGNTIISFFIAHDMQVIFIVEEAPKDKRATIYAVTKALGTVGLVLVPITRRVFMDADSSNWRPVFLTPAIMGIIVSVVAVLIIKESKAFVDQRVEYLKKPLAERFAEQENARKAKAEKSKADKAKSKSQEKSGVFPAIKYCFTANKDIRMLTIIYVLVCIGLVPMTFYNESIMHTNGMSTADITAAQSIYPFVYAAIILVGGIIGDKLGRKISSFIWGALSAVAFTSFIFGSAGGWNPYVIGVIFACFLGGFWTCIDYLYMMAAEKVPTEIRASVLGGLSMLQMIGLGTGMISTTVGMQFVSVGTICAAIGVPPVVLGIILLMLKTKETKGSRLNIKEHT
jgi:MFS family permease